MSKNVDYEKLTKDCIKIMDTNWAKIKSELTKNGIVVITEKFEGNRFCNASDNFGGCDINEKDEIVRIEFIIDGKKSGIKYTFYSESDGDEEPDDDVCGDAKTLHDPVNSEKLHDIIKKIFESNGIKVKNVHCSGHSSYWDYELHYTIETRELTNGSITVSIGKDKLPEKIIDIPFGKYKYVMGLEFVRNRVSIIEKGDIVEVIARDGPTVIVRTRKGYEGLSQDYFSKKYFIKVN